MESTLFAVERTPLLGQIMDLAQRPKLVARGVLDSRVAPVLRAGGYKGHAPVTTIVSLIGVVTSALNGHGPLVLSNERSADSGNVVWHGHQVNHQWAKSSAAEQLLREALTAHTGLRNAVFSLLSGLSEVTICQLFSGITSYDSRVTSCNNAFRLFARRSERWCQHCPKCRFVFLALAPFTDRPRLVKIFGTDLLSDREILADPRHLHSYQELLGLAGHKPFECVGEIIESRVVLGLLLDHPDWARTPVVSALRDQMPQWPTEQQVAEVFATRPPVFAPPGYGEAIARFQAAMPVRERQPSDTAAVTDQRGY